MLKKAYQAGVAQALADAGIANQEKIASIAGLGIGALAAPEGEGWSGAGRGFLGGMGGGMLGGIGGGAIGAGLGGLAALANRKKALDYIARGQGLGAITGAISGEVAGAARAGQMTGKDEGLWGLW